jgi:1,4-dihydroxy-2-naphthoate octaprenyltransferase
MVGAIAAHICVNLHEYFDFKSGLTRRPPRRPSAAAVPCPLIHHLPAPLIVSLTSFFIVAAVGTFASCELTLLPIGLAGMLMLMLIPAGSPATPSPVAGAGARFWRVDGQRHIFCLTGEYAVPALLASLIPFFLVANLLLLNQPR